MRTATAKKKKPDNALLFQSKETREIQNLIELVVRNVIAEKGYCTKKQAESQAVAAAEKAVGEVKQQIAALELKISAVEIGVASVRNHVDDHERRFTERTATLTNEMQNQGKTFSAIADELKQKQLSIASKLQKKFRDEQDSVVVKFEKWRDETNTSLATVKQELVLQQNSVSSLRDGLEDLLIKRYGFVPAPRSNVDALNASFNQGVDAGMVIEQLEKRVHTVEDYINNKDSRSPLRQSQSRLRATTVTTRDAVHKDVADLAEALEEMQLQLKSQESQLVDIRRLAESTARKNSGRSIESSKGGSSAPWKDELSDIRRKIRGIGDSTSQACRTLAESVGDLQESTLHIYSWADQAADGFALLSEKLHVQPVICPRIHAHTIRGRTTTSDYFLGGRSDDGNRDRGGNREQHSHRHEGLDGRQRSHSASASDRENELRSGNARRSEYFDPHSHSFRHNHHHKSRLDS